MSDGRIRHNLLLLRLVMVELLQLFLIREVSVRKQTWPAAY